MTLFWGCSASHWMDEGLTKLEGHVENVELGNVYGLVSTTGCVT